MSNRRGGGNGNDTRSNGLDGDGGEAVGEQFEMEDSSILAPVGGAEIR